MRNCYIGYMDANCGSSPVNWVWLSDPFYVSYKNLEPNLMAMDAEKKLVTSKCKLCAFKSLKYASCNNEYVSV